jgi:hypothetical protein
MQHPVRSFIPVLLALGAGMALSAPASANPAYYVGGYTPNPAGSPQYFDIAGSALFQDALSFNPSTTPVVGLRYLFHLEGTDTAHFAYADLGFNAGMNSYSFFVDGSDPSVTDWATPEWQVSTILPIPISGEFQSVYGVNTNPLYAPQGQDAVGISNFYDTLTLSGIQLLDANGNQVNGVGYSSESGTHYNVLGGYYASAAVPEPGAVTLLLGTIGAGLLAIRRRGHNTRH